MFLVAFTSYGQEGDYRFVIPVDVVEVSGTHPSFVVKFATTDVNGQTTRTNQFPSYNFFNLLGIADGQKYIDLNGNMFTISNVAAVATGPAPGFQQTVTATLNRTNISTNQTNFTTDAPIGTGAISQPTGTCDLLSVPPANTVGIDQSTYAYINNYNIVQNEVCIKASIEAAADTTFVTTEEYLLSGTDTIGIVKRITEGTNIELDTTYFPTQNIAQNYIPRRVLYSDTDSQAVTLSPIWISANESFVIGGENETFPNSFRGLFNYSYTDFGSSRFGFNQLKVGYNSANNPNTNVINALVIESVDSTTNDFTRLQMGVYGNTSSGFKPQLAETIRINFESDGNGTATIGTEPIRPVKYIDFVTDINALGTGYSAFKSALRIGMIDYSIEGENYKKGQFVEGFYTSASPFLNNTTATGIASYDDLGRRFRTGFDYAIDIAISKRLYADNAAAIAAGWSVGQFYYNTTDEKLTRVQ